eukprot:GHRQ01038173.1.p1 GENE.GHRQ01038173.1~~GHRQ01038173.1.p1  ORF type:complete len:101 (-),score=12.15 GHRQ01038173.1:395-667(-)
MATLHPSAQQPSRRWLQVMPSARCCRGWQHSLGARPHTCQPPGMPSNWFSSTVYVAKWWAGPPAATLRFTAAYSSWKPSDGNTCSERTHQ